MEICGILPVHKPAGPTSHDLVNRMRSLFGIRKIGHTGTLDPLADGLLVFCLGRATKITQYATGLPKTYRTTVRLGQCTTTGDAEGTVVETREIPSAIDTRVKDVLQSVVGKLEQKIPAHSAVKVKGRKLYEYTRTGTEVPVIAREVEIGECELLRLDLPILELKITCSGGTYIRSLAEEIGDRLGCGGHVRSLTRLQVGAIVLNEAVTIAELEHLKSPQARAALLREMGELLPFARVSVTRENAENIRHGRPLLARAINAVDGTFDPEDKVTVIDETGRTLAVMIAETNSQHVRNGAAVAPLRYDRVLIS